MKRLLPMIILLFVMTIGCSRSSQDPKAMNEDGFFQTSKLFTLPDAAEMRIMTKPWPPTPDAETLIHASIGVGDWSEEPFPDIVSFRVLKDGVEYSSWTEMFNTGTEDDSINFLSQANFPDGNVSMEIRIEADYYDEPVFGKWKIYE